MMNKQRQRGISIIEIAIVLVIIGLLASAAWPAFNRWKDKAEDVGGRNAEYDEIAFEMKTSKTCPKNRGQAKKYPEDLLALCPPLKGDGKGKRKGRDDDE